MQGAELHGLGLAHLLQSPEASTLNLNVLRRINPDISQVLACANHVALYDFDRNQHRWVRKEVEGSFFLIAKTVSPFHQIIILNKKNADNFVEDVVPDLGFEVTLPYIMYRNKTDEVLPCRDACIHLRELRLHIWKVVHVIGVWFYEEDEAKKVALLLHHITEQYRAADVSAIKPIGARQLEHTRSAARTTAAMPFNSTSMESKIIESDQETGFWDKPIKQPAGEDSCARHLQHFGAQEALPNSGAHLSHQNTLEKLFANMKVPDSVPVPTSSHMPVFTLPRASAAFSDGTVQASETGATTPKDESGSSKAAPPPHAPRPALLTPKFLANAKVQPVFRAAPPKVAELQAAAQLLETSDAPLVPNVPLEQDDTSLTRFFAAASRTTSTQSGSPTDAGMARNRLRRAIAALSQSDAFIEALAKELSSAGLFE